MSDTPMPPEGWYDDTTQPGTERFWDGAAWTNRTRLKPPPSAPPPPTAPTVSPTAPSGRVEVASETPPWAAEAVSQERAAKPSRPWWKKKRFIIPGALILVVVVAGLLGGSPDDETDTATSGSTTSTTSESAEVVDTEAEVTTTEKVEEAEKGTQDNPYTFGEPHSRKPGLLGAGWTVSIDDVVEIPLDPLFTEEGETRVCLAVLITATLDSLDSDELVSNPLSLPDVNLIDGNGQKAPNGFLECDGAALDSDGAISKFDVELIEGGTAFYRDPVITDSPEYQFVAIEKTVYARG